MKNIMNRQTPMVMIGFGAILAFAWFCYAPAISGAFQFDDFVNLAGLSKVEDVPTAIEYVFSGYAGPTGRPLALASFAMQAEQWRQGPSELIRVNIFIHLVNAVLLALALYQVSLQRAVARYEAALVATVTAGLWVLIPLLATASLLVVQRMTTLSATFMLLGLSGYLLARARIHRKPKLALSGMSACLVVGTLLAALCKESGLLLPVLVLVLEASVLARPGGVNQRHWQVWQLIFLWSPLIALLGYLFHWLEYPDTTAASRGFNAWERLLTESRVLWIYLSKAVVAIPSRLGIYQYPPSISRSLFDPLTMLASLGWIGLSVTAIYWRRRYPLYSVAVLWYLAGHLIESTVVPLELYFEHRNYVPLVGPLFGLGSFLVLKPAGRGRIVGGTVTVLALVNAWFLYSFSTLSGHPSIASRYWAETYPDSVRAVSRLATYRMEEEGLLPAMQTIENFVTANPEYAYMRLLELNLACRYAPDHEHLWLIEKLERELPAVDHTPTIPWMLYELFHTVSRKRCNGVDAETVASLATILRDNPHYADEPLYNRSYQMLMSDIARQRGDYDMVIDHLELAIKHFPTRDLNEMMITALTETGDFAGARNFINNAASLAPANPLKAYLWTRDLERLRQIVQRAEHNAETEPNG